MNTVPFKTAMSSWWSALVITHRYLGIVMSVPMLVWFLSGIVMIYVPYPHVSEKQQLRALEPIDWRACCQAGEADIDDESGVLNAQVENQSGQPALRVGLTDGSIRIIDLARGTAVQIDADRARAIAAEAAPHIAGRGFRPVGAERIDADQWTFGLDAGKPLFRFTFDDPDRTNIYVSGASGQVVLWTTATQRFWNWLGAIPHWLYFAALREHVVLWSQILIWAALLGTFLTALGLFLGIAQIKSAEISPYRGWLYWHHVAGLLFGLATLAWVLSGFVSMNPWGFLEQRLDTEAQRRLEGRTPRWSDLRASLGAIHSRSELRDAVSITSASLAGQLYWIAKQKDGGATRLDAAGNAAPLSESELAAAAHRIAAANDISEAGIQADEDAYYFRRGEALDFPVYRVIVDDADQTRYYIDAKSGSLLQGIDSNGRLYRWIFGAWHRLDFATWVRASPIHEIAVFIFSAGGLCLAIAGSYLAFSRVRQNLASLFNSAIKRRDA
jgi:PepSY-associated TM region